MSLLQAQQKKEDSEHEATIQLPPDNHFNLVCLVPWEDEIIWSSTDYKPKPNSYATRTQAGWIPSGNIRTMKAYLAQYANKGKSFCSVMQCLKSRLVEQFHLVKTVEQFDYKDDGSA